VICRPHRLLLGTLLLALASCGSPAHGPPASPPSARRPDEGAASTPTPGTQLALVRPPQAPCLGREHRASVKLLLSHAARELAAGEGAQALTCADEALRASPRMERALHLRAAALTELGQLDDARLAYAQALAIDPDDPETLLGVAELYASRLSGGRPMLALGRDYALRGARVALRRQRMDRELAGQLFLLAAMAENDLGESQQALDHADRALALGADEGDGSYERGVALYELCRFAEARASLQRVLAIQPDDAWAIHQLALLAEARGDLALAAQLDRRARKLDPSDFPAPVDVDRDAFEQEVRLAVDSLPEGERRALKAVPVEVAEVPTLDDLTAVDPPLSPSILGLFRGPSEGERCLPADGPTCRSIVFYRRNLERFARDRRELREQVRVTLLHELGHLHGESEEDLRARGLE
jgi:predicted Zn-dependent protease with MMP-like domain/Flp pilus assembly protein TadD